MPYLGKIGVIQKNRTGSIQDRLMYKTLFERLASEWSGLDRQFEFNSLKQFSIWWYSQIVSSVEKSKLFLVKIHTKKLI